MKIEELDFDLPEELIAERPSEPRDACRLMVVHRGTGLIEHHSFLDLSTFLKRDDLLVLNSARVTPARMFATLDGDSKRELELLLVDAGETAKCRAMFLGSGRMADGTVLTASRTGELIRVGAKANDGLRELELISGRVGWRKLLEIEGHMPLPPYILKRRASHSDQPEDRVWYQTIFADRDGAIAAPTAGLHFSAGMLAALEKDGVNVAQIFLKVGIGTFQPVRTATVEEHQLVPEEYEVGADAALKIAEARARRGRVVAVGTTAVRTLEFCAAGDGVVRAGSGSTGLMIAPPYRFRVTDVLLTNFHLPKSTLLALVYAFAGMDLLRRAYAEAVREKYRFFSYGDAMLIL